MHAAAARAAGALRAQHALQLWSGHALQLLGCSGLHAQDAMKSATLFPFNSGCRKAAGFAIAVAPQVRLAQLDKEGAELREENADLHRKLQGVDEARDRAAAAEVRECIQV